MENKKFKCITNSKSENTLQLIISQLHYAMKSWKQKLQRRKALPDITILTTVNASTMVIIENVGRLVGTHTKSFNIHAQYKII